jgi:hypothetical protein
MTRFAPVECTGASRARGWVYVRGLGCLLFVAYLLPSLMMSGTAQAQSAALASTTPEPRAEVVDGVPLIPTTKAQRAECEKFADHLKRPVPCPGLLPDSIPISPASVVDCLGMVGAGGETSCGPAGIQLDGNLFELQQANFRVPPGYVGVSLEQYSGAMAPETSISGGPLGHFVFMSGTNPQYVMTHKHAGCGASPAVLHAPRLRQSHSRA